MKKTNSKGSVANGSNGMREDFLDPRMLQDDAPWVRWYEGVKTVPAIADKFNGLPYNKMDNGMRLRVKKLHLEATKRQRMLDEAGSDNIYVNQLVALFNDLEKARSQREADQPQRQIATVLARASDPEQLAIDAYTKWAGSMREQAAPAMAPAPSWDLPTLPDYVKKKFGADKPMGPAANINVPGGERSKQRIGSKILDVIGRLGKKKAAPVTAVGQMLLNLFGGAAAPASNTGKAMGTAIGAMTPPADKPMGTAIGGRQSAATQSAPAQVGPMSIPVGGQMPAPVAGQGSKAMGTAIGAMTPPADKPMGTAIGAQGSQAAGTAGKAMGTAIGAMTPPADKPMGTAIGAQGSQAAAPETEPAIPFAPFNPSNIVGAAPAAEPAAPAAAPAAEPAAPAAEPAAPAQAKDKQQGGAPKVAAPFAQGGGQPPPPAGAPPANNLPPKIEPIPQPSVAGIDSGMVPDYDGGQPPSYSDQPPPAAVAPQVTQPSAPQGNPYDDMTFKQAFARARARAEMLPDDDPSKYTFKWRGGDYQTNYRGKGTKRKPQEPYVPKSQQKGYVGTAPIVNPYENPDQFKKKSKKKKKKKSTNESHWAKSQMLLMNRLAPAEYRKLVSDHSRESVLSALMEMDASGLSDGITDGEVAERYVLRARDHLENPRVMEDATGADVARAISNRLINSGKAAELVRRHGLDRLMDAIGSVAEFHAGAEELGSSDISIMVNQVISDLDRDADGYNKAYESANDFIGSIRDAVSSTVKGDRRGAAAALDKAKNATDASNLPIATGSVPSSPPSATKPAGLAAHIGQAVAASKKGDKQGVAKALDAAKAVSAVSRVNDPDDRKLLAALGESPAIGDAVLLELADGRMLQARISEASGSSMILDMDETGMQWLDESPDHSALRIGSDGRPVSRIAERWNSMVDDLQHDTPAGWADVFTEHAGSIGADPTDMPRMWGKIWRQQHERLGDSLTRQDQEEWANEVASSMGVAESAETNGQFTRHNLAHKDPAMLAVWMKSHAGTRGQPVKGFARGVARRAGEPEDAYWDKIRGLVSEKRDDSVTDAEDMIASGFTDDQVAAVTGLSHKHIHALRRRAKHATSEAAVGYSEPYDVGRKQGMHNIHSNPYSKGSPASQKWSAGHMAAAQGLGEDDSKRRDNRLWLMITDYEERARKTKNDLKRDHYMKMASELRDKLTTNESDDRRSFTVSMRFEDGGKVTRVFMARAKDEALRKAMSWAKNEYDPEQGVEARVVAESKAKAAVAIDRFFGGMAANMVASVLRRAGVLALQGRHGEAEAMLRKTMRDADPDAAKKVVDAVRNIKPVTMGKGVADTSAIEKSAAHTDWLDNTFVPWVMRGLGQSMKESISLGPEIVLATPDNMKHHDTMLAISMEIWHLLHKDDGKEIDPYDPIEFDKNDEKLLNHWDNEGRKLGYEPAIEIDDYPFPDVNWQDKKTGKVYKFKQSDLKQDQRFRNTVNEAKYHGKEVPLGKPIRTNTSSGGKFKVYVRDPKTGNIKMVRFGDTTGLSIKRDDPKRRKNFRARHHCDNPGPRTKARYWSCRMWTRKPVGKILKGK